MQKSRHNKTPPPLMGEGVTRIDERKLNQTRSKGECPALTDIVKLNKAILESVGSSTDAV